MFNLTHLRRSHPVILTSEYLRLHNLSADVESSNGAWSRTAYHEHANVFDSATGKRPSLQVIENSWFDPKGINRVDVLPDEMKLRGNWSEEFGDHTNGRRGDWGATVTTTVSHLLSDALPQGQSILFWEQAREVLQATPPDVSQEHAVDKNSIDSAAKIRLHRDVSSDEGLEGVLRSNGWEVLYTYDGA
jgi:hypothetical protein